jgi:hypothetical protein
VTSWQAVRLRPDRRKLFKQIFINLPLFQKMPSLVVNTNIDLGSSDAKNALMTKLTQVLSIK